MVMPLYDDNPFRLSVRPVVTWLLSAANVLVFAIEAGTGTGDPQDLSNIFGMLPTALFGETYVPGALPPVLTLVTYMFLHGGFGHLFGNMIFLWVFGDNLEQTLGRLRFLIFYLLCGVIGALVFAASDPEANVTLIGASGAISGLVVAYLMLRPCAKITILVSFIPLRIRAYWVIGAFILMQFVNLRSASASEVAYWCHVGGMAAGAVLFLVMKPAGVRLFECMEPAPVAVAPPPSDMNVTRGPWG